MRPPARVSWGWRSSDEMADVWIQVMTRSEADRARLGREVRRKMAAEDAIGCEVLIARNPDSLTGRYLSGALEISIPRERRKPGGKALERATPLGGVLDDPYPGRQSGQLLIGRAHHDNRPVNGSRHDPGHAMEQRGAVPLEACLRPPHAGRAAPGEHDAG